MAQTRKGAKEQRLKDGKTLNLFFSSAKNEYYSFGEYSKGRRSAIRCRAISPSQLIPVASK